MMSSQGSNQRKSNDGEHLAETSTEVESRVNRIMEQPQTPGPALGQKGQKVVQVNVEEDMPIGGGTQPVDLVATDRYNLYTERTIAMIAVAIIVAILLAMPVIWVSVELFALAGIIGPWIWAWVIVLIGLLTAVVAIGFRIARSAL